MVGKLKLKQKILLMLLLPLLVIFSALGLYSYRNAKDSLGDQIKQTLTWMADDNGGRIHGELQNKAALVGNMAQMIGKPFVAQDDLLAFLQAVKTSTVNMNLLP